MHKKLEARYHRAGATIDSSLYLAAMQAGIPADVVVKMIHMFSYEVDFQRDLKPGNSFEVLYNYYYTPDGQPAKEGDIQYAALNIAGRTVALYRYKADGEAPDYFDSHGQSAKNMLMKTPVDGARITSGFGMRFHPILGYSRMHKGVDFGVPIGTPVMAAGSGVIEKEGRLGGYGNFVEVNHQNGYATAYGHLSRFAPGIHVGSRVRQGQIIAYSGNSGMSTGPHLHYEIRLHDVQVNPASVKVATGIRMAGKQLRDFLVERLHVDTELASMALENRVAEGGGELRAAKD
jgi:murein DD-endopeptidase MepM/ murein hydrolase activator NlpD